MYLFLCVSVLCLMFLCVIPVLCLWALLPELKLMMMMIRYDTVYLTCSKRLTSSQLSLSLLAKMVRPSVHQLWGIYWLGLYETW